MLEKKHDTRPYIKDIAEVVAKRGEKHLHCASIINGEKKILDFICKKYKEHDMSYHQRMKHLKGFQRRRNTI